MTGPHFFARVAAVGLTLPGVEASTRYDGSPVLKLGGAFMAGVAMHPSAEPETIVVRIDVDDRDVLLEEAPETYYLTDYYRPHPVILARLSKLDESALRDLLTVSRRLTLPKARTVRTDRPRSARTRQAPVRRGVGGTRTAGRGDE